MSIPPIIVGMAALFALSSSSSAVAHDDRTEDSVAGRVAHDIRDRLLAEPIRDLSASSLRRAIESIKNAPARDVAEALADLASEESVAWRKSLLLHCARGIRTNAVLSSNGLSDCLLAAHGLSSPNLDQRVSGVRGCPG